MNFAKGLYWHFKNAMPVGLDPLPIFLDLVHRYSEPHRRYHTVLHVEDCLNEYLNAIKNDGATDPAVVLAIFWHDAVYQGVSGDDESRSADLLEGMLPPSAARYSAASMIRKTDSYAYAGSFGIMGDCDLAGLGKAWPEYEQNRARIRAEYRVSDAYWNAGRAKFLASMLALPRIFSTEDFYGRYEARARENMSRELAALEEK